MIQLRAEINEIENRKQLEKIHKSQSWLFEKIKKIDKPVVSVTKEKRGDTICQHQK